MNIVTAGDSKFYHCLQGLCKSVGRFYAKQPIVYDIGLRDGERDSLNAHVVRLDVDVDFYNYATFREVPFIQATHKPFCVKHYFDNYTEPMILIDADCLFMERVEETGFDVGVTLKPRKNMDTSDHYAGVLASGVVFFNTNAADLIDRWIEECRKPDTTDQKALTDILSETIDWKHYDKIYDWNGLQVKVFRVEEFNDYYLRNGKIFHFKGERHEQAMYNKLIEAIEQNIDAYRLFKKNRKHRRNFTQRLIGWLHNVK